MRASVVRTSDSVVLIKIGIVYIVTVVLLCDSSVSSHNQYRCHVTLKCSVQK